MTQIPFRWTAEALLAIQEVHFSDVTLRLITIHFGLRAHACFSIPFVRVFVLQSMEDFMVRLFEDTNLCAIHAKRVTISESPLSLPSLQAQSLTHVYIHM